MRLGLWLLVALLFGAVVAHFLLEDKGYVLLSFRGYIVEMSVPILLAALALIYLLTRLLIRVFKAPRNMGEATARYRHRKAARRFTEGLIQISEGNWARGEKLLTKGVQRTDTPLLNYLAAARAAQLQGAYDRRDNWLKMAYEETPAATTAILLTQAELQIAHKQYEEAVATLRKLDEQSPNHAQSLALQARLYSELDDWESLRGLLPRLRKRKALPAGEIDELAAGVHGRALDEAGASGDAARLAEAWQAIPRPMKKNPGIIGCYVEGLMQCKQHDAAEQVIYKALKSQWDEELILKYGKLETSDPAKQLQRAESWLRDRGEDPDLLLTAARLCLQNQLWGKARSYLETSLAIRPRAGAYQVYGQLMERLGEADQASEAFRSGLALVTAEPQGRLPAPEPEPAVEDAGDGEDG